MMASSLCGCNRIVLCAVGSFCVDIFETRSFCQTSLHLVDFRLVWCTLNCTVCIGEVSPYVSKAKVE